MFFYSIDNYDYSVTLMHEKQYTEEEFVNMCKCVDKSKFGNYSQHRIINELVNQHGFIVVNEDKISARFNIDNN